MHMNKEERDGVMPWSECPRIYVCLPTCPFCGAGRPYTLRSCQNGDGSVTRRSTCRECHGRFLVVVEAGCDDLPETGGFTCGTS